MITTTPADTLAHLPSQKRWEHLLKGLGVSRADREPLAFERILEINGLEDALCVLQAVKGHDNAIRLFACHCARYCLDIFEQGHHPDEKRPCLAIETAERHAYGQATDKELAAARAAAGYTSNECHPDSFFGIPFLPQELRPDCWLIDWLFGGKHPKREADLAMYAASQAAWATCIAKATDAVRYAVRSAMDAVNIAERVIKDEFSREVIGKFTDVKNADEGAARDDFTRELFRLCRLEGTYGEVSGQKKQSRDASSGAAFCRPMFRSLRGAERRGNPEK